MVPASFFEIIFTVAPVNSKSPVNNAYTAERFHNGIVEPGFEPCVKLFNEDQENAQPQPKQAHTEIHNAAHSHKAFIPFCHFLSFLRFLVIGFVMDRQFTII